ncbi:MAG TPA: hypothetical protein VIY27_05095 [Myxococcota bacterium]
MSNAAASKPVSARVTYRGMGGFLNPPTHPEHHLHVETDLRRRPENRGGMSLSAAAECDYIDPRARAEAQRRLAKWEPLPIDDPAIVDWVHQVLGYFRGMYQGLRGPVPPGTEWHVENLFSDPERDPVQSADSHAGVHYIRKFYPEYMPTAEDFAGAYWGTKPEADNA